jgi:hypothetical protein
MFVPILFSLSEKEGVFLMKNPAVFYGAIVVAVISLILGIYYAIPGIYHVATSGSHPANDPQPGHIALFIGLAVICGIAAAVTRPKSKVR